MSKDAALEHRCSAGSDDPIFQGAVEGRGWIRGGKRKVEVDKAHQVGRCAVEKRWALGAVKSEGCSSATSTTSFDPASSLAHATGGSLRLARALKKKALRVSSNANFSRESRFTLQLTFAC